MASPTTTRTDALAAAVVRFLETGAADPGLFAPDVFCDLTLPTWRLQSEGRAATIALRTDNHPCASRVTRHRVDPTPRGFVLELEEEWVDEGARPGTAGRCCAPTSDPRGSSTSRSTAPATGTPARSPSTPRPCS